MRELGEDAPLLYEAAQDLVAVHPTLETLERHGLAKAALLARGQPHLAHATAPERTLEHEWPDALASQQRPAFFGDQRLDQLVDTGLQWTMRVGVGVEHAVQLLRQQRVILRQRRETPPLLFDG